MAYVSTILFTLMLSESVAPRSETMSCITLINLTSGFTLTLQETRSIHDSMNLPKIEFIS